MLKSWKFKVHEVPPTAPSQNLCNEIPCVLCSFCYRLSFRFLRQELITLNETQTRQFTFHETMNLFIETEVGYREISEWHMTWSPNWAQEWLETSPEGRTLQKMTDNSIFWGVVSFVCCKWIIPGPYLPKDMILSVYIYMCGL